MSTLDGDDKAAIYEMIHRLMKEGEWTYERRDRSLTCGVVQIHAYMSGHVSVHVNGYEVACSLADWPWGLGVRARFFHGAHERKHDERKLAEARLALLRARPTPPETP